MGLKEVLQVGTGNAVSLTGKTDGYFRNQAIKIPMPDQLRAFENWLRPFGFGPRGRRFCAEHEPSGKTGGPAGQADLSGDYPRDDLRGSQTAATDYFKGKTTDKLTAVFRPEVKKAMNDVGVTKQYKELVSHFKAIQFAKSDLIDIDRYVVGKSFDGLFVILTEEERKIRTNPAARVTDLLKEVFAKAGSSLLSSTPPR